MAEGFSEFEDLSIKLSKPKNSREKRLKKNEQRISHLWANVKYSRI